MKILQESVDEPFALSLCQHAGHKLKYKLYKRATTFSVQVFEWACR